MLNNTGRNLQFGRESVVVLLCIVHQDMRSYNIGDTYPIYFGINKAIVMTFKGWKIRTGVLLLQQLFFYLKAGGTVNSAPLKLIAGNSLSATEIGRLSMMELLYFSLIVAQLDKLLPLMREHKP